MVIRQLAKEDAAAYFAQRREALLQEPFAFSASPEDDRASDIVAVESLLQGGAGSVVFGAFDDDDLIGSIGVYRETKRKLAHKAHVWGVYVRRGHRRRGVGRLLMLAAIAHARELDGVDLLHLTVSDRAEAAHRLYRSLGFELWGTEPDSLFVDGQRAAEHHLVLAL